eukprot:CAMPEP_0184675146 /NCGR_PEP_ID=MMETSP0308-20130426/87629_1 /TAXON_ID=38269 /ORGANISM="Gloeochaete witrockiana, Strain SAG 46.84" /LENGTH=530 /DNA_ID=CAMNT_0027122821 /DNA_START=77 /DNA_END=1669 /DNA_ORIENTATION=+
MGRVTRRPTCFVLVTFPKINNIHKASAISRSQAVAHALAPLSLSSLHAFTRSTFLGITVTSKFESRFLNTCRQFTSATAETTSETSTRTPSPSAPIAGPKVVILGGGFGGLYSAVRLSQYPWARQQTPNVTLVDQNDRFVFSPLLYELLSGEVEAWEIAPRYTELFPTASAPSFPQEAPPVAVSLEQADIHSIDLDGARVWLTSPSAQGQLQEVTYDKLVLALGGVPNLDAVPGARQHAIPFRTLSDAEALLSKLTALEASGRDPIRIAIVGGGFSGVELACKLSDRLKERGYVQLLDQGSSILKASTPFNREEAMRALARRGVWVDLNVSIVSVDEEGLTERSSTNNADPSAAGTRVRADIVLWTAASKVSPLIESLPPSVERDGRGRLVTSSTLQLPSHPNVYALGDICMPQDSTPAPPSAQAAIQQADYVAWNVWAGITGRQSLPFRYMDLGEMLTLGTDDATLSSSLLPGGFRLSGMPASVVRKLAYLYRMPTTEHQLRVGLNWLTKPLLGAINAISSQFPASPRS